MESTGGDDDVLARPRAGRSSSWASAASLELAWREGESRQTRLGPVERALVGRQVNEVAAFLDVARARREPLKTAGSRAALKTERDSAASFSALTIRARGLAPSEVIPNANKGEAASGVGRSGF